MESKYYTPEIEEFFYGFKYEFRNGDSWKELIFNFNKIITGRKLEDLVRVKYLDQQDIEDCGFIPDYERTWGERMCFTTENCAISYQQEIQRLIIATNDYNFPITVKNKSEFKKLMKQLNITKE
jgi:hypothetical protein